MVSKGHCGTWLEPHRAATQPSDDKQMWKLTNSITLSHCSISRCKNLDMLDMVRAVLNLLIVAEIKAAYSSVVPFVSVSKYLVWPCCSTKKELIVRYSPGVTRACWFALSHVMWNISKENIYPVMKCCYACDMHAWCAWTCVYNSHKFDQNAFICLLTDCWHSMVTGTRGAKLTFFPFCYEIHSTFIYWHKSSRRLSR